MRKLLLLFAAATLGGCVFNWISLFRPPNEVGNVRIKGDAVRGEDIFRHGIGDAPPCLSCHSLGTSVFSLGPKMTGISERAGQRVPGLTAEAYLRQSIREPGAYIVPGYRDIMYPQYAEKLSKQDIADLIAFLSTL